MRRARVGLLLVILLLAGCSVTVTVEDDPAPSGAGAGFDLTSTTPPPLPPDAARVACTVEVAAAEEIQDALGDAEPGDVICLAGGEYALEETLFSGDDGTEDAPITLRAAPGARAVLSGPEGDPGMELNHDWWVLTDLEFTGADILLRLNDAHNNVVTRSLFHDALGECVRIRDQSTHNAFTRNRVWNCGLEGFDLDDDEKNGEGVYIGTAPEQRDRIGGVPDHSNANLVEDNWFRTNGSEAVDIKEDSEGNIVRLNVGSGSLDPDGAIFNSRGDHNTFTDNVAFGGAGAGFRMGGDTVEAGEHGQAETRTYGEGNVLRHNDAYDNGQQGYRLMVWPQEIDCSNTGRDNTGELFYVDDEEVEFRCPPPPPATPVSEFRHGATPVASDEAIGEDSIIPLPPLLGLYARRHMG